MTVELVRENQKKIKSEQEINDKEKDIPYWYYLNNAYNTQKHTLK